MRIRSKVLVIFATAFLLTAALAFFGFPLLFAKVSQTELFSLSRILGAYAAHDLQALPYTGDHAAFEKTLDGRLEFKASLGKDSGNYSMRSAVIVGPDFKSEIGHPDSVVGIDYSSHPDIVEAMKGGPLSVVLESPAPGSPATDADILAPVALADGDRRVVEVKLDLSASLSLLEAQYAWIRAAALGFFALAMGLAGFVLATGVSRSVLKPLLKVSAAMERLGAGDLDATPGYRSGDEIGAMARRFDEMAAGLRERFQLERYVSKSTVGAAKDRASRRGDGGAVVRKSMAVLFTDVRGFTSYAETRDPARVVAILNRLLGMQEEVISACGGEVDKFVADETMAVFAETASAVTAALAIRTRLDGISAEIDGLRLGFGIHFGELVEGDIGSPRMMDHTVIGDTVNTASRLESTAKAGQILVSTTVASDRTVLQRFETRLVGELKVKGKAEAEALRVFEVLAGRDGPTGLAAGAPVE